MTKKLCFVVLVFVLTMFKAQETDLLSIPNPVEFNGSEFFLARAKQRSKTLFQQQYVPKDEQLENFNQILDFSYFTKEIDIEMAVKQKVESVAQRAKNDRYANANVTESPDGKEYIVDFMISEAPEQGDSYVEYDVYRFKNFDDGTQKSFLMLSYAKRIYGDLKSAAKTLGKQRDQLMTAMIEYQIPQIKVPAAEPKK